jgi:hypothetical protein
MDINNASTSNIPEGNNIPGQNQMNINQSENNIPQNIEKNATDKEENDNLGYMPGINNNMFNNFNLKQRLDSTDSPFQNQFKFSIDMPNASKQRLHEFLNEDLLNAIDTSPNIPKLSNDFQNIKNENNNMDNNPNNLLGFSLYAQNPPNIENNPINQNNQNGNPIQDKNFFPNKDMNQRSNQINITNNNFPNMYNNNINFNNYNYNINIPQMPNNNNSNNQLVLNLNNNTPVFIPKQLRNKDYKQKGNIIMNEKNMKFNNNMDKMNAKNKFDNNKKNLQNMKKEGKVKKPFEVRAGDWTCAKCNNLNFSFRNKCNRCGIPKELSDKLAGGLNNQEMMKRNKNFNFQNDGAF